MTLSPAQRAARDGRLTASRIGILMSGEDRALLDLWREMVGDPGYQEADLSDVWPVQLGACTEQLHLDWIERQTGLLVKRRGEVVTHPDYEWACCTLDGWQDTVGPVEVKHVNAWSKPEEIRARYYAQLTWQMLVTDAPKVLFSVIYGAKEPEGTVLDFDPSYAEELWSRALAFMDCVWSFTPPVALAPVAVPAIGKERRTVDLRRVVEGQPYPNWGFDMHGELQTWLQTIADARDNAKATAEIKSLLPDDVGLVLDHGVQVTRARNGAVSIKEQAHAAE